MLVQYIHPHGAQERVRTPFGAFDPERPLHVVDPDVVAALQRNVCFHFVDTCECDRCNTLRSAQPAQFEHCRCESCTAARAADAVPTEGAPTEAQLVDETSPSADEPSDDPKTRPGRKKARE